MAPSKLRTNSKSQVMVDEMRCTYAETTSWPAVVTFGRGGGMTKDNGEYDGFVDATETNVCINRELCFT
jgi:hypothetical protein